MIRTNNKIAEILTHDFLKSKAEEWKKLFPEGVADKATLLNTKDDIKEWRLGLNNGGHGIVYDFDGNVISNCRCRHQDHLGGKPVAIVINSDSIPSFPKDKFPNGPGLVLKH